MEGWKIAVVAVVLLLVVWSCKRELFGESIYLESGFDIRGDSEKRPAVYTSGATQRIVGQMFSATDQGLDRSY